MPACLVQDGPAYYLKRAKKHMEIEGIDEKFPEFPPSSGMHVAKRVYLFVTQFNNFSFNLPSLLENLAIEKATFPRRNTRANKEKEITGWVGGK